MSRPGATAFTASLAALTVAPNRVDVSRKLLNSLILSGIVAVLRVLLSLLDAPCAGRRARSTAPAGGAPSGG